MLNRIFRKMGLNGKAVLPMVLGLGCDTMATLTARIMETKKEAAIVTLLLALGVPCSAQLGVIMAMFGPLAPAATMIWLGAIAGSIMPKLSNIVIKALARTEWYLKELPLFIAGTLLPYVLDALHLLNGIQNVLSPLLVGDLGLPAEASNAFVIGFLRRDYGAAGLFMMQEQGKLDGVQTVALFILVFAFGFGALMNHTLRALGVTLRRTTARSAEWDSSRRSATRRARCRAAARWCAARAARTSSCGTEPSPRCSAASSEGEPAMQHPPADELLERLWYAQEERRPFDAADGAAEELIAAKLAVRNRAALERTSDGAERARGIVRRHRLAEILFTHVLEADPHDAETSACEFEHILAERVVDRVCTFLGHPPACPHGHPIPRGARVRTDLAGHRGRDREGDLREACGVTCGLTIPPHLAARYAFTRVGLLASTVSSRCQVFPSGERTSIL